MPHRKAADPVRRPSLLRQRIPFLPLVGLGAAGIVLTEILAWPGTLWSGLLIVCAGMFVFCRSRERIRSWAFALFVIFAFALIHLGQSREGLPARAAKWLGNETPLVEVTGLVAHEPRVFSERSASFEFHAASWQIANQSLSLPITLIVRWPGPPPALEDRMILTGVLRKLPPPRNPGDFDFASWSERKGNYLALDVGHPFDGKVLASAQGSSLLATALRLRQSMAQRLSQGINDPVVSDLILAMVLGDTSAMPENIQKEFRGTGTFHLFSVSGLHVGILSVILWYILATLRVPRSWAALIIIPALFFYALMTGFQAASVRSAVMASIMLAGFFFNRQPHLLNNLCAAGFLILLFDTNQLFNAGFQLSFMVVAVILLLSQPLTDHFEKPFQPDPFFPRKLLTSGQRFVLNRTLAFVALTAVSLAAWLGSLPLTLGYFHLVSLTAMPANLLAVPLSFAIMVVAALSLGASVFSTWVGEVFNQTNWLLTKILLAAVHFFAGLPASYVYLAPPPASGPLGELVVFDAGSGGAIWLQSKGHSWMIDCGSARFEESTLLPFLRQRGRMALDGLVITHGDAAHIAGAVPLLEDCPPHLLLDSVVNDRSSHRDRLHRFLAERNQPKTLLRAGDEITVSPTATMRVLYPPGGTTSAAADDKALVLMLTIGPARVLLMSDSGALTENWLLQNAALHLPCDILIKGASKSGPSGEAAFLDLVKPKIIIASSARFPTGEAIVEPWAASLAPRGIRLYRQDATGAVTIKIYSQSWEITDFLTKTTTVFQP